MINAAAMNATLHAIKFHGTIEDSMLVDELQGFGWDVKDIDNCLNKIVDWVCHGMWDLNVPVKLGDGIDVLGRESTIYIWG
jgi:hypothetical protein